MPKSEKSKNWNFSVTRIDTKAKVGAPDVSEHFPFISTKSKFYLYKKKFFPITGLNAKYACSKIIEKNLQDYFSPVM